MAQDAGDWIGDYWGKAQPDPHYSAADFHPLAWHMLDVAATAAALLRVRPVIAAHLGLLLGMAPAQAGDLLVWLAANHDLGKFARPFQSKVPALWRESDVDPRLVPPTRHDADGMALWTRWLSEPGVVQRIWADPSAPPGQPEPPGQGARGLSPLLAASLCHHGAPVAASRAPLSRCFGPGLAAAESCRDSLFALLLPEPVAAPPLSREAARRASHWVAGLVTLADWLGSSQHWFPYAPADMAAPGYWDKAQAQAERAVREAGLVAPSHRVAADFATLARRPDAPTPLQRWALEVPIPAGPALFLLEDVTGAGKTEAAHVLAYRLLAAGRAGGLWWAMPTMATANAMYARQAEMLAGLFDPDGPRASLALAHGQAGLHPAFRASVTDWGADETGADGDADAMPASAACAAFLADDRRLSLLADVGAGTIDQAVLAVLPSRFNTVRLLGLADKVLIVDEVHAHDAYVTEELRNLLAFHAAQGGSAILLSATLTNAQRRALIAGWQGTVSTTEGGVPETRYPLATVADDAGARADAIAPAPWSARRTPVTRVESPEAVLDRLEATLAAGGCAAWVRNTVDDAVAAAEMARARGLAPVLFHARFTQWDRQRIEAAVAARFGRRAAAADRAGGLVIATQVLEQSLDVDFDQLASDLAPIDLLLQRAGRMRRHPERRRPAGAGEAMLVLSPAARADAGAAWLAPHWKGTGAVYRDHGVLWRTAREIDRRGAFAVPDAVRAMVEAVLGEDDCPDGLRAAVLRAEGAARGTAAVAQTHLLRLEQGYTVDQPFEDELRVMTRNAEPRLRLRLARRDAAGRIVPWAGIEGGGMGAARRAWALSEVAVGNRVAPRDAQSPAGIAGELAPIVARWGRFERDIPVCVLFESGGGRWEGALSRPGAGEVRLGYGAELGLFKIAAEA